METHALMIILSDIDDTVMLSAAVLQRYLEDECGLTSEHRLADIHNIPKAFGIDQDETLRLITQFHRSRFMEDIPPMPCAAVVLPELHRRGYRFVAITACLNEPEVVAARQRNLKAAFGFEWEAVHCIGLSLCKKDALKLYPKSIWVDDLPHHAAAGAALGHRSFLIDKLYNQDVEHPDVTRVIDWHELEIYL
jgi:hypothetical protein